MPQITPDLMKGLVTEDGALQVGESITNAVEACLVSKASPIREEGEKLKAEYKAAQEKWEPVVVDYSGSLRTDAYCVYYLPRNTLVPKLALLACSHHQRLRNLGDQLSVLDIGTGPGSVALGLLDLFQNEKLSGTHLSIVALDGDAEMLERQKALVRCLGIGSSSLRVGKVDLEDPDDYRKKLSAGAPYDIVFAANVFGELRRDAVETIMQDMSELLGKGGIFVNVESESNYAKLQRARVARKALDLGMHRYYPCPLESHCPKQTHPKGCWVWREDKFECADIRVGRETLYPTDVLRAHLMILCTEPYSIHDVLKNNNPNLTWGVVESVFPQEEFEDRIERPFVVCTDSGCQKVKRRRKKGPSVRLDDPLEMPRGHFFGYNRDCSETAEWDII